MSCFLWIRVAAQAQPQDGLDVRFVTKPGPVNIVQLRFTPEVAAKCAEAMDLFPSFRPMALVELGGQVVDTVEIPPDDVVRFVVPVPNDAKPGHDIQIRVTPSAYRTPKGEDLFWGCNFLGATGSPAESTFVLDVGYPTDSAYLGRRFSYQEGPSRRPETWARDRDYRWAEPGFTLRLPIVSGNPHEIRMVGHVPVGFRVMSGEREMARFDQPSPETNTYTFPFDASKDAGDWLHLRVEPIAPFPPPNLDLRSLFFALERVEVVSKGGVPRWDRLPSSSLIETSFRAAVFGSDARVEASADWENPGIRKREVVVQQEWAARNLFCRADNAPPPTQARSAQPDASQQTAGRSQAIESDTQGPSSVFKLNLAELMQTTPVGEVAILVSTRQIDAQRRRPTNNLGALNSAFGAFVMLNELQIPCVTISENQIPSDAGEIRCVIVPNPTWMTAATWQRITRFAEKGGIVISTAHVAAFGGEQRAEATGLFGAAPKEYHRYFFNIPFGEKNAYAPNSDWQAIIAPTTAKTLAPLLNARGDIPDPPPPAVTVNRVGEGAAVLLSFDSFDFYARFGAPPHRDLVGWIIGQFVADPRLEISGSPSIAVSLRRGTQETYIGLANMSRGHFDYGGLMNSARPIQCVEDIPRTGPIEIRYRVPQRVTTVEFFPPDDPANWTWENGILTLRIHTVHAYSIASVKLNP